MPEVREAIGELGVIAREYMSTKAGEFVQNAFGEIKRHECNVNNDRSFKPFIEVLLGAM